MAEIWLLCEGKSDIPVLASVLTTVLAAEITPKPSGGSSNAASAAGFVAHNEKSVTVAYVVDRDYRRREVAEATFTDGKRCFMWRRHAIESYLLEPMVIVEAFRRFKASLVSVPGGGPAWAKGLPEDMAVVAEGLRSCAKARAPQEAGRIALQRLWEDLSETAGRIQKRTAGHLGEGSPDATLCRQSLLDEAARIVMKAQETVASPHLVPSSIGRRYDDEFARVSAAEYLDNLRFLEEFHGKDLLDAFLAWLQREFKSKLSYKYFVKELEAAVPVAYRANRSLYGTDDFLDLANGVRALAGLPPIA